MRTLKKEKYDEFSSACKLDTQCHTHTHNMSVCEKNKNKKTPKKVLSFYFSFFSLEFVRFYFLRVQRNAECFVVVERNNNKAFKIGNCRIQAFMTPSNAWQTYQRFFF